MIVYAALIIFSASSTAIQYNPETAEGNTEEGRRVSSPVSSGRPDGEIYRKITTRLTLIGTIYITVVCLIPEFLISAWNVQFYFGGTSLLIVGWW